MGLWREEEAEESCMLFAPCNAASSTFQPGVRAFHFKIFPVWEEKEREEEEKKKKKRRLFWECDVAICRGRMALPPFRVRDAGRKVALPCLDKSRFYIRFTGGRRRRRRRVVAPRERAAYCDKRGTRSSDRDRMIHERRGGCSSCSNLLLLSFTFHAWEGREAQQAIAGKVKKIAGSFFRRPWSSAVKMEKCLRTKVVVKISHLVQTSFLHVKFF